MILSMAVFRSCCCSASFEVIPVQYTRIPGAPGSKSEQARGKQKVKW
jgi:hypothetical protein